MFGLKKISGKISCSHSQSHILFMMYRVLQVFDEKIYYWYYSHVKNPLNSSFPNIFIIKYLVARSFLVFSNPLFWWGMICFNLYLENLFERRPYHHNGTSNMQHVHHASLSNYLCHFISIIHRSILKETIYVGPVEIYKLVIFSRSHGWFS